MVSLEAIAGGALVNAEGVCMLEKFLFELAVRDTFYICIHKEIKNSIILR